MKTALFQMKKLLLLLGVLASSALASAYGFPALGTYYKGDAHEDTAHYHVEVRFDSSNLIFVVSYQKGPLAKSPYFTQTEIDYLLAVTARGKVFKEIPHTDDDHLVGSLWKLYRSTDGKTEATVGYTMVNGSLQPFSVQLRTTSPKVASSGKVWFE